MWRDDVVGMVIDVALALKDSEGKSDRQGGVLWQT